MTDTSRIIHPSAPLIVMVGPPGSGKSTWAATRFPVDQLFGLDMFRRMLTGNVADQGASDAAARMLDTVIDYRMDTERTTVVDATNTGWNHRNRMRSFAHRYARPVVAVQMHTPLQVCLMRNANRLGGRPWPGANDLAVPAEVIERMHAAALADPPRPADFDLVVHVHPDDPDVAYALAPQRHSIRWTGQLLDADPWGKSVTLLTGTGARLPWQTPVNDR